MFPPTGSEHGNVFLLLLLLLLPGKRSVSRSTGSEASSCRALVTICFSLDTTEGSGSWVAASAPSELLLSALTSTLREYWTEMPPGLRRRAGLQQMFLIFSGAGRTSRSQFPTLLQRGHSRLQPPQTRQDFRRRRRRRRGNHNTSRRGASARGSTPPSELPLAAFTPSGLIV